MQPLSCLPILRIETKLQFLAHKSAVTSPTKLLFHKPPKPTDRDLAADKFRSHLRDLIICRLASLNSPQAHTMAKFLLVFLILSSSELLLAQGRAILPVPEQKDTTPEDSKLETTSITNLPFVSDKKLFDMLSQICAKEMLLQLNAINKINKNTNDDKPNLIVCKALNAILPKRNHPLVRRAIEHEKIKVVLSGFGDMDVRTFVWMLRKLQWQNHSAKQMAEEVRRLINELYLLYEGKHKKPLSAKALAMQRMAMLYVQQRYGSNPKPIPVEDGPPSTAIKDREEFDRITSEAALRAEAEALEYKKNPRPKSESDRILEERFEMERQQKVARFSERTETEQ